VEKIDAVRTFLQQGMNEGFGFDEVKGMLLSIFEENRE